MLDSRHLPTRFWDKVSPEPNSGCWLWLGAGTHKYGQFYHNGRAQVAHRVAFKILVKPIPPNYQIDHLCKTGFCVNPDHLEAVTPEENMRRTRIEYCRRGHKFVGDNIYYYKNDRQCKACRKIRLYAWRSQHRGHVAAQQRGYRARQKL